METVVAPPQIHIHNQSINSTVMQVPAENGESTEDISYSQKNKMALSRRPSYRKILSDLSLDAPRVTKIEEAPTEKEVSPNFTTAPPSIVQTNSGQYISVNQGGPTQLASPGRDGMQGRQAVAMPNSGMPPPAATVLQHTGQSGDMAHQYFMPGRKMVVQAATGDMSAYQICSPTSSLPQGVMMAVSPASLHSPQQLAEEATRKRELRLLKNREAARECRRKKKEYVKCLENRVAVLENQNKTLIQELKALKDLYCHKAE